MNYLKNIGISLLYIIGIIIVGTFLISLLNYINFLGGKVLSIFKILIPIIALFTGGIMIGKKSNKNGWLEGLKLSLIFLIILLIFNYLALNTGFELKNLIYYLILIISTCFGSMIGINKKKEK